jgi:hypothetical protein
LTQAYNNAATLALGQAGNATLILSAVDLTQTGPFDFAVLVPWGASSARPRFVAYASVVPRH